MNYKTINKPKLKLINCTLNKNISHNKASNYLLNFLNYFTKTWRFISNAIFNSTDHIYDENDLTFTQHNNNYNITDTTELRLIASRRTFM